MGQDVPDCDQCLYLRSREGLAKVVIHHGNKGQGCNGVPGVYVLKDGFGGEGVFLVSRASSIRVSFSLRFIVITSFSKLFLQI